MILMFWCERQISLGTCMEKNLSEEYKTKACYLPSPITPSFSHAYYLHHHHKSLRIKPQDRPYRPKIKKRRERETQNHPFDIKKILKNYKI